MFAPRLRYHLAVAVGCTKCAAKAKEAQKAAAIPSTQNSDVSSILAHMAEFYGIEKKKPDA